MWPKEISVPTEEGEGKGWGEGRRGKEELSVVSSYKDINPIRLGPHPYDLI